MIRTHIIPCKLPKAVCDALNEESGRIYSQVLVYHWRTYRKKQIWLSSRSAKKINDYLRRGIPSGLYAHTVGCGAARVLSRLPSGQGGPQSGA